MSLPTGYYDLNVIARERERHELRQRGVSILQAMNAETDMQEYSEKSHRLKQVLDDLNDIDKEEQDEAAQ